MSETINFLDEFIKQNAFVSMLLGGILCNFIYEFLKKTSFHIIKFSIKRVSVNTKKNIEKLIKIYSEELEEVRKLYNNTQWAQLNLIDSLYRNILYSILLLFIFLLINKFSSNLFFYSFLGASISLIFNIIKDIIYNYRIIQKSKDFINYENKISSKIEKLILLLNQYNHN